MTANLDRHSLLKSENPERNSLLIERIRRRLWLLWAPDGRCAYGLEKELAAKAQLLTTTVAKQIKGDERLSAQALLAWMGVTVEHHLEVGVRLLQELVEPIGFSVVPLPGPSDIRGLLKRNAAVLRSIAHLQETTSDALADGIVSTDEAVLLRGAVREAIGRLEALDAELGGCK